ncbi:MAG TPA: MarR family transcriptional regulator [Candidatus Thioglobus sp.]|jgi:DNA-binding MarR family transcriptional regulator|nr:MarR family transcriptional regulator [Candidatus Thioglobus sp.]HIL21418.1 MarR family transcriptional regulator [Candidatus Thioglobus sp.]
MDKKNPLRLWLRLLKTSRLIEAEMRERFATNFNTTLPRFDVMAALSQNPEGLKMSQLSGALRVSNGNVTGIVERLSAEGLVDRNSVIGDRRILKVILSKKGRLEFSRLANAHKEWINELLEHLPENETIYLSESLEGISQQLLKDKLGKQAKLKAMKGE